MIPKLIFNGNKAQIVCTCCKSVKDMEAKTNVEKTRYDYIFDLLLASMRTQGYHEGYVCRKCEKTVDVNTKHLRSILRKRFTLELFEEKKDVRVITGET